MPQNAGRVGHTDNDPFNLFVCYVVEKMKPLPRSQWKQGFYSLTVGRDDIKELRLAVWERLK